MSDYFLFGDLETFGLFPETDPVIEITLVATNSSLRILDSFTATIWGSAHDERYAEMCGTIARADVSTDAKKRWLESETFVMKMHTDTGLWERAMLPRNPLSIVEAEAISFLNAYGFGKVDPLCGSSISFDRNFLAKSMPRLNDMLSHRIIDVSSFKEMFRRKFPDRFAEVTAALIKMNAEDGLVQHNSLDDCLMSINELKMYSANFFIKE